MSNAQQQTRDARSRQPRGGREPEPRNLHEMLDRLDTIAGESDRISVEEVMEAVGQRSFGPILLVVGLVAVSPLSGIPTVPSILGVIIAITAAQMFLPRQRFWLPGWIRRRATEKDKFQKGLKALRPMARRVDKLLRPRLEFLTGRVGSRAIAGMCVIIGATMPPLEILPFLATTAGAALTMFGLAMIARDGVFAIAAFLFAGGMIYLGAAKLLSG